MILGNLPAIATVWSLEPDVKLRLTEVKEGEIIRFRTRPALGHLGQVEYPNEAETTDEGE
jgi:hypothetical protein